MNDLATTWGPWAFYLAAMGGMLKWLVTDKIKGIQDSLIDLGEMIKGQDERLRELERQYSELIGGLKAKGCLVSIEESGHCERRKVPR